MYPTTMAYGPSPNANLSNGTSFPATTDAYVQQIVTAMTGLTPAQQAQYLTCVPATVLPIVMLILNEQQ